MLYAAHTRVLFNAALCFSKHRASLKAESVPILSAPVKDIIVCCVMHCMRAINGCCRAKHQETTRLMKTWRKISRCSFQYTEKQTEEPP